MGEADSLLEREAERAEGEMDLRFLNEMLRFSFGMGVEVSMSMVIAK